MSRARQNLVTMAATFAVSASLMAAFADGTFTQRISEIGKSLDRAIGRVLELQKTNYTDLPDDAAYNSSTAFNARGMGGLYNLTLMFVGLLITGRELYPEGELLGVGSARRPSGAGFESRRGDRFFEVTEGVLTRPCVVGGR